MFSSNASQVSNDVKYIEDVCSVYLRTGTGSSQTVTTGIKENTGALVISKSRSAATDWAWYDTFRGATYDLVSNSTAAQTTQSQGLTSFNTDGHTWGTLAKVNTSGATYVDTVLKPTPKFFDVVTYTGNGVDDRQIAHSLGSTPGCVMIKRTDSTSDWVVSHNYDFGNVLFLNTTAAAIANPSSNGYFGYPANPLQPTYFTLGTNAATNASGGSYVAYVFASDAGGFGLTGTDNVISCGSYTGSSSSDTVVNLGYEPQFVMIKKTNGSDNWLMFDSMRGLTVKGQKDAYLWANSSNYENQAWGASDYLYPTATGFALEAGYGEVNADGFNYIYIAIRRGPMKAPTSGTSVFAPSTYTGNDGSNREITGLSFTPDLMLNAMRSENGSGRSPSGFYWFDRLRGKGARLRSSQTLAEYLVGPAYEGVNFQSYSVDAASGESNYNPALYVSHLFKRAPSFFDEVCYTGTGSTPQTIAHNLEVAPELMIIKGRSLASSSWIVYAQPIWGTGIGGFSGFDLFQLNNNGNAGGNNRQINETAPTASVFSVGYSGSTFPNTNNPSDTFVAYLFATCAGVSKIGKYTGTGTTLQIDCGFTSGARFVLIKRADSNGDWYVWDSARGIVSGNDPYLLLNTAATETTGTDYIDTYSAGFEISSTAPSAINASGGTFIFLAIA